MSRRVLVLKGGWSAEREVSLATGANVTRALTELGHDVIEIDAGHDLPARITAVSPAPEVVFNALHGTGGEDGTVQGLLEVLGLPYTHSRVLASALAMHKPTAKKLFAQAGLACPLGRVMTKRELLAGEPMARPFVIKPVGEGSSVGVRIVDENDPALGDTGFDWPWADRVLVEEFIPGREITVAVKGGEALGVLEIRAATSFYDYEAKYTPGRSDHILPAELPADIYAAAMAIARDAHACLGCRGVTRADLRFDDMSSLAPRLALLEVNTQPGLTPTSLVPEIAAHAGIAFPDLVNWMVEDALCRG